VIEFHVIFFLNSDTHCKSSVLALFSALFATVPLTEKHVIAKYKTRRFDCLFKKNSMQYEKLSYTMFYDKLVVFLFIDLFSKL